MKLHIIDLEKSFGENQVLQGANFVFEEGRIYGLLGRNGAGKTTLFDLISNKKEKDKGQILLEEEGVTREIQQEDFFYMVANPQLPNFLTGREFLKFFREANRDRIRDTRTIDELFDWIFLEEKERDRLIQSYSLGTRNKLQMLMFVLLSPKILLMDEPLTSLDVLIQMEIKKLLKERQEGHIILFSTHILQLAKDLCEDIVILHKGKLSELDFKKLENEDFERELMNRLAGESHD